MIPFALSEHGEEEVCLSSADVNGVLTGYQEVEDFKASQRGVSFGRYYKPTTGNFNFVAMDHNTPGSINAYPRVGPIVINEIMYKPNNSEAEYVELYNITGNDVNLYDASSNPWKVTDGIDCNLPTDANIPAHGFMLLVKNLAAFNSEFSGVPGSVRIVEWSSGKSLSNALVRF